MKITPELLERFWAKVEKSEEGCWRWKGAITGNGRAKYRVDRGIFRVGNKTIKAHRFSYTVHYGPIPDGLCVCHHCDNGLCVRPDHMFLGTQKDNIYDMIAKGRNSSYKKNSVEDHDIPRIKDFAYSGLSLSKIAKIYGVDKETIRKIVEA